MVSSSSFKRGLLSIVCLVFWSFAVYLTLEYGYCHYSESLFDNPEMQGPNSLGSIGPFELKIGTIIVMLIWGAIFLLVWSLSGGRQPREDGTWGEHQHDQREEAQVFQYAPERKKEDAIRKELEEWKARQRARGRAKNPYHRTYAAKPWLR